MATLNISLPDQLREWISTQVESGRYSSASDYLRDLIRSDQREQIGDMQKLGQHLQERMQAPNEVFVRTSAEDVKTRARQQLSNQR